MHKLPGAFFRAKDHGNPQSDWGDIFTSANLCLGPLYLEDTIPPTARELVRQARGLTERHIDTLTIVAGIFGSAGDRGEL